MAVQQTSNTDLSDAELEHYIDLACVLVNKAPDFTAQREAAAAMARLIGMRSRRRVMEMEIKKGLR